MAFNSPEYLLFFLLVLGFSWAVVGYSGLRVWLMLLASYYFYTSNNHWLILLILISTQIDYLCAIGIEDSSSKKQRRTLLNVSLCANLGILALFKYFNFFAASIADSLALLGFSLTWVDLNIALPVGISFYTFQSLSYTIDVYRGVLKAERSWPRFAFFVAYFPQLVAGPIVRPTDFLPQLDVRPRLRRIDWEEGLQQIFQGLFKKIVLADFLAVYADRAFDAPHELGAPLLLLGVWAFTFQIYFDFCGYSDIAIGCSRLMGFRLPENFRRPYAAVCITDFWRRWHISLSSWLRDYLYISLGGSRMSSHWGVYRNLMITMLLGGLWHGAAWHFVIWGGLQGGLLVIERAIGLNDRYRNKEKETGIWKKSLATFTTLHLVALSWVVFRADSTEILWAYLVGLSRWTLPSEFTYGELAAIGIILGGLLSQLLLEHTRLQEKLLTLPIFLKAAAYGTIAVLVTIMGSAATRPFIYFRF